MKTHMIVLDQPGGPEALTWREVELAPPGPGEVRLHHHAVGLNYIDVYHRTGVYPLPSPSGIGIEAMGVVEALGEGVEGFSVGDRVAYAFPPVGAYAERRNAPASILLRLPDVISDETAAAMMLKGLTAQYLLRRTHRVKEGETILVHAAAGGVGLILCQWAKALGATVIGTVGDAAKADLAVANGCDHPILYREDDVAARVRDITNGAGVPVVYDAVGAATFEASIACLQPMGLMVSYGQASGPPPAVDLGWLSKQGSLFITRPTVMTYMAKRADLEASAAELFDFVGSGAIEITIGQSFALKDAADAHRALEGRATTGSTILTV